MKNTLVCLCAGPSESMWEGMGPGLYAIIYNGDAIA